MTPPKNWPMLAIAITRQILRTPSFWILQLGYVVLLLWWRFAVPWNAFGHGHGHSHGSPDWVFDPTWPCFVVYLWLLWSLSPRSGEGPDHHWSFESRRGFAAHPLATLGVTSSSLRLVVESAVCLLVTSLVHGTVLAFLGVFHVELQLLGVHGLLVLAACCSVTIVRVWTRNVPLRLLAAIFCIGFPEYLRRQHVVDQLGITQLVSGTLVLSFGLLCLSDGLLRTHALRHSR